MADYWKSQPRHFCEFCKCWIADNKPSRDYHEKGKKHQENVAKKIVEVRKKGAKQAKKQEEENSTMKAIEKAALRALKEDIKKDPSLADKYGIQLPTPAPKTANTPAIQPARPQQQAPKKAAHTPTQPAVAVAHLETYPATSSQSESNISDWHEAKSPDSYTYYWNSKTQEVTWTKPEGYVSSEDAVQAEGFVSLEKETTESIPIEPANSAVFPDCSDNALTPTDTVDSLASIPLPGEVTSATDIGTTAADSVADSVPELPASTIELPESTELPASVPQTIENDADANDSSSQEEEKPAPVTVPIFGPARKPAPYGSWETVKKIEEKPVDLQLPEQKEQIVTKAIPLSEPKIKFREKKVDTLGAELVAFKKRKLNTSALRKRDDDS